MEELERQITELIARAVEYGKTTIELAKLKAVDQISDVAASLISKIVTGAALLLFVLFASIGMALWLGEILGKIYLGFFAVAAAYGVLGILIPLLLGRWIKKVVCNYIIKIAIH